MGKYNSLRELVMIDSPSGFTDRASAYCYDFLKKQGWKPAYTNKGAVRCAFGKKPKLAIAAHVDTLGMIVSGVNGNGTLKVSKLGGPLMSSYDSEYCRVYTMDDHVLSGTLLFDNPSIHANREVDKSGRTTDNMHVRLDEVVSSVEDVEKLGIRVGDIICFDTRYQQLSSGFIKSRYMDNKAGCYVLFELARRLKKARKKPAVEIFFSNYEEVGHGGTCGYSESIEELLVIDMGVIGDQCAGRETHCSICAKDSTGPYDYEFRRKLVRLAEKKKIPYKLDVYPYYGSDGSAALAAGNDFRVALIGPGVAASHGMERTHIDGIEATIDLCMAYIDSQS